MWHVWHDVGKKGSRTRALGRRYFVLIWPRRCVVAWVAREREARFAKFRAGVLGSRVVVQARRTWWLAAPAALARLLAVRTPKTTSITHVATALFPPRRALALSEFFL